MSEYLLVQIDWEDSRQPVSEWQFIDHIESKGPAQCQSVGWLISEDNGAITLAANLGEIHVEDGQQAMGVVRIPIRCVIKTTKLGPVLE